MCTEGGGGNIKTAKKDLKNIVQEKMSALMIKCMLLLTMNVCVFEYVTINRLNLLVSMIKKREKRKRKKPHMRLNMSERVRETTKNSM